MSNAVSLKSGKTTFSHTQYEHTRTPVPRKILQDTPTSDTYVFSEHSNFTKCRKVETISQKLDETNKRPHNLKDSARLKYPVYCASRTIEIPKSGIKFTRGNRFDRPVDQGNVEQGCNFSSKKSAGSVSGLIVFGREKR